MQAEFTVRREPGRIEISMPVEGEAFNTAARVMMFLVWGAVEVAWLSMLWQRAHGGPGLPKA